MTDVVVTGTEWTWEIVSDNEGLERLPVLEANGWQIVSIVPTGTTDTFYKVFMKRDKF